MGGYAFFVWLAVAMTVAPLALLALHTVLQRRAILRGVAPVSYTHLRAHETFEESRMPSSA